MFQVLVSNSWYADLVKVNPRLKPPDFSFPGAYGSGQIVFTPRPDGLLDLTFTGSTFLPLGTDVLGEAIRMPLPFCGPLVNCFGLEAKAAACIPTFTGPPLRQFQSCGANCPDVTETREDLPGSQLLPEVLAIHFHGQRPQLGGTGNGAAICQGRYQCSLTARRQPGSDDANRLDVRGGV